MKGVRELTKNPKQARNEQETSETFAWEFAQLTGHFMHPQHDVSYPRREESSTSIDKNLNKSAKIEYNKVQDQ